MPPSIQFNAFPEFQQKFQQILSRLDDHQMVDRLWRKDSRLWTEDSGTAHQVQAALGWLDAPGLYLERVDEIEQFTAEVRDSKYKQVVLLGMGGSSLCPEVFRRSFGPYPGFPELLVLDSTDPAAVAALDAQLGPGEALFIVSSKSGTTTETLSFFRHYWDRTRRENRSGSELDFVAITDPGTPLEAMAKNLRFRRIFPNSSDIGGRFSALSYFGILPGALMGLPVKDLLQRAVDATLVCQDPKAKDNPAATLAAFLAAGQELGRDKLTLIASEPLESLGLWIEQLVAESTGKEGKGVLPVVGEGLYLPKQYGQDRVFVYIGNELKSEAVATGLQELQASGQPVLYQRLSQPLDIGAIFIVWEAAVALVGSLLQINPFDQPNVQESKENTAQALRDYEATGRLAELPLLAQEEEVEVYGIADQPRRWSNLTGALTDFLGQYRRGDYVAFTPYLPDWEIYRNPLNQMRQLLAQRLQAATTLGFGPRFLHSTGQLHKGGANRGLFLQITADDLEDLDIPQAGYSFGTLKRAQAYGDLISLSKRERRALRLHLGKNRLAGLERVLEVLEEATASLKSTTEVRDRE